MPVVSINAVEADHVSLRFGRHAVLDNVSIAVPAGAYVGIVGPNGGGKTTLLRIILGLMSPSLGTVKIFGEDPVHARHGGRIGYVPQRVSQINFAFPATALEIVKSGRTPRTGIGRRFNKSDFAAVDRALEITGITNLRNRIVGTLSGGERQKVFIARSLASEPRILILDEPTTGVDRVSQEQFYALLKKLNADFGLTILFVSHDVETIARQAGFVLALNQKLICHCSAHDFLSEETLKRLYGDEIEQLHHHHH
jgi:zinc transport system ATP-binding protein